GELQGGQEASSGRQHPERSSTAGPQRHGHHPNGSADAHGRPCRADVVTNPKIGPCGTRTYGVNVKHGLAVCGKAKGDPMSSTMLQRTSTLTFEMVLPGFSLRPR